MFLILNNNIYLSRAEHTSCFVTFVNNKIYLLRRPVGLRY